MLRTSQFFLRNSGVCVEWQIAKGFGFITDDVKKIRYFAHVSAIPASLKPHKALSIDEKVEFDLEPDRNGRTNCVRITAMGGGPVNGTDTAPPPRPARAK